jgi:type I restriction enzyme M protein
VIVPAGVMFGTNKAAKRVRDILLTDCDLQAVVELPDGVFQPYSTVTTACLIFQKGGPTKSVWFYELRNDGFTLSDTRTPIPLNDIPDVLAKWPTRAEGLQSRTVPVDKIIENEFRLMSAGYRPVALQTVEHREPKVLLEEIIGLERQIAERAATLRESISR